jgi:hypothetical protein
VGGINSQRAPESNYTSAQWDSLWDLLENLCGQFPDAQIRGHRDFPYVDKSCPCFDVQTWWIGTRIDETRVSVRSRIAYHMRAAGAIVPELHQSFRCSVWDLLELTYKMSDEAFDV